MRSPRIVCLITAAALAVPAGAFAHHGWSSYDASKTIEVTGSLTDVEWVNPHGQAKVAHQGKTWTVILAPLTRMEQRGLTREMLAPGKRVTIQGYARSDGTPEMRIERVLAEGKTVELR